MAFANPVPGWALVLIVVAAAGLAWHAYRRFAHWPARRHTLSALRLFTLLALVFILTFGFFITPAILGGPATQVLATAIYGFMTQLLDWSVGAALAVILVVSSLALLYLASLLGTRRVSL